MCRRIEADPYLNECLTEEYYIEFGLQHLEETNGLFELLDRHYADVAKAYKDENGKQKMYEGLPMSVFKLTLSPMFGLKPRNQMRSSLRAIQKKPSRVVLLFVTPFSTLPFPELCRLRSLAPTWYP